MGKERNLGGSEETEKCSLAVPGTSTPSLGQFGGGHGEVRTEARSPITLLHPGTSSCCQNGRDSSIM